MSRSTGVHLRLWRPTSSMDGGTIRVGHPSSFFGPTFPLLFVRSVPPFHKFMTVTFLISLVWIILDYDNGGCWVTAIEDGMQCHRVMVAQCHIGTLVQVIKDTSWLSRQFGLGDHIEPTVY